MLGTRLQMVHNDLVVVGFLRCYGYIDTPDEANRGCYAIRQKKILRLGEGDPIGLVYDCASHRGGKRPVKTAAILPFYHAAVAAKSEQIPALKAYIMFRRP